MPKVRKYIPATFTPTVEMQLEEVRRRMNAQAAADLMQESLGTLFAFSPESFSDSVFNAVVAQLDLRCPASFAEWMKHWTGKSRLSPIMRLKYNI